MSQVLRWPLLTVDEFFDWEPPPRLMDFIWELGDDEPVCMAPPGLNHAAIQRQAAMLLGLHLRSDRPSCRVLTTPGIIPKIRARANYRIPDPGVSCGPFTDGRSMTDPVLLVEILSPSNEAGTRANVWTYATIASGQEVLILSSTSIRAEILGQGDDAPIIVATNETLRLDSFGYEPPLSEFYATTDLG